MRPANLTGLIGLEFNIDTRNCYTLVRDFYRLNFGIELADYACPTNWWASPSFDLFGQLAHAEGFQPFHGRITEWRTGDLLVMEIAGNGVGNHLGIVLPKTEILHHLVNRRSEIASYGGLVRNSTIAVYRHPAVPDSQEMPSVPLTELLPLYVRRRLENL